MEESSANQWHSASVGDYLKAIWELSGNEPGVASTKSVSEKLVVAPASVTNMFVRLQEMGLADYERYHGASLTGDGQEEALRLVRRHRLIETFLLEHLGYSWQEVHEEAERLEHVVSDNFTEKLAELLGHPRQDPHGDPIPNSEGALEPDQSYPLSEARQGDELSIYKVSDEDAARLDYLGGRDLVPGRRLRVLEVRELDAVVTVEDEDGGMHSLGEALAGSIFVSDD